MNTTKMAHKLTATVAAAALALAPISCGSGANEEHDQHHEPHTRHSVWREQHGTWSDSPAGTTAGGK